MDRPPVPLPYRLLLFAAVASATPAATLFARGDACAAHGLEACAKNLPDRFCCPRDSSCIALAGATTVLCCPNDRTCSKIQPIVCNVREQDPDKHPTAPIKTNVFDVALPKCGRKLCCPFGYSCSHDGKECTKDDDQSKPPKREQPSSSPTITTSLTATATEPSSNSATDTESATSDASATPSQNSDTGSGSGPDKTPLIGGIVGGSLGLLLIILVGVVVCIRRRRRREDSPSEKLRRARKNGSSGSSGPYGNIISAPILHPGSYRSDFLRGSLPSRSPTADPPTSSKPQQPQPSQKSRLSIPNPFNSPDPSVQSRISSRMSNNSLEDCTARTGRIVAGRLAPVRIVKPSEARLSCRPSTRHVQREPSGVSINVFADPSTVRHTNNDRVSAVSAMTEEAGPSNVHRGRPYISGTRPMI